MTKKDKSLFSNNRADSVEPQNENFSIKPQAEAKKNITSQKASNQSETKSTTPQEDVSTVDNTQSPPPANE